MTLNIPDAPLRRTMSVWLAALTAVVIAAVVLAMTPTRASAVATPVPLGTATSFAVLAGSQVTNTGPSSITGDLGVSPGTAITGFPPGTVIGAMHSADAVALQAKSDLVTGYNNAAGQAPDVTYPTAPDPVELGGRTLDPGVYKAPISAGITGTLTLDAHGDPNAVWVFQIGSTLTTASGSNVSLVNGASPCNVYWQIGSSATLGTNSMFVGTIMAQESITVTTGTTIAGRALARTGAVTLDNNTINRGTCAAGGTTGGLITGGVVAGATSGGATAGTAGTTGSTTVGVIGGVPTGGGTGGLLGGVLTSGGTTGGVLGGVIAGATTSGTTGGTSGTTGGTNGGATAGSTGGSTGGNGDHDHDHGHKPGGHDHGGKPEEHGGYGQDHGKPAKPEGYGNDHEGHHKKSA
ncbi:ice-binding family protein [Streptomyces prunicolor]|uniref:Ice-binding family protein n=1 Tax=Streptomyces prunicolor TaxID=67348 RepID=A0ABU4F9S7_9ACTN|nr:ice-binding family protein [Streptomyces prunicolor]MDV7217344.1 ice-binding family protein [Streptomyces prunicolor]